MQNNYYLKSSGIGYILWGFHDERIISNFK